MTSSGTSRHKIYYMNDIQRMRVQHAANTEAVRRMLVKYFMEHGFKESFDKIVNPAAIQDLPFSNPGLDTKIDIEPHALEIDPTTSHAVLGWNLFVLGNQRMFLGESHHSNLSELARQIKQNQIRAESISMTRRCTTPRRIITFIERVLSSTDGGYVDLSQRNKPMALRPRAFRPIGNGGSAESQFYTRTS